MQLAGTLARCTDYMHEVVSWGKGTIKAFLITVGVPYTFLKSSVTLAMYQKIINTHWGTLQPYAVAIGLKERLVYYEALFIWEGWLLLVLANFKK